MSNNQDLIMSLQGINSMAERRHNEIKELLYKTYLSILELQEQGEAVFTQVTLTVGGQPYLMSFAGKKHLFAYTATTATLSASDFGSFSIAAGTWVALEFPETTRISLTGTTGTTQLFVFKATDEFIATPIPTTEPITGSISVLNFPSTQIIRQSSNNAPVAVGAGNTIIKGSPGDLVTIVVTTAGTTGFTVFDNATTNAGTQLYNSKAAPALGDVYNIFGAAKNGIVVNNTATGPALTVFFN